jgi:glycerophosphoryl diester phosphodiesterase
MISTSEGLILIDTGYPGDGEALKESIEALGFSVNDVKIIIHSHGHRDHSGASSEIVKMSGAKTYLNFNDKKYIKDLEIDFDIKDGDVIRLGETEILALHTPGHTEGTVSLFFNVSENGKTYRAGMFGGAGTNQLKKAFMRKVTINYLYRGEYYKSIERLHGEHVDIFIGNHTWNTDTKGKAELMDKSEVNPFLDSSAFSKFLDDRKKDLDRVIEEDQEIDFVNYAHRGASEYRPENTMESFRLGLEMGANGIETDVHITKDGVPVLFHDDTLDRVTNGTGSITQYTYEELCALDVIKGDYREKIPTFREFLDEFAQKDITFAIELKQWGTAEIVIDILREYNLQNKCVITSFSYNELKKALAYGKEFRLGHLTSDVSDEHINELIEDRISEICPKASLIIENPELVKKWHKLGLNVRAWGVSNESIMKGVFEAGVDGMTVNFPDKLTALIKEKNS